MRQKKALNVELGERIRQARNCAKVTQERLAEMIEVSPQYISDLERGVVGLSVATLRSICVALHVDSDFILFGTGDSASINMAYAELNDRQRLLLQEIIRCYISAVCPAGTGLEKEGV